MDVDAFLDENPSGGEEDNLDIASEEEDKIPQEKVSKPSRSSKLRRNSDASASYANAGTAGTDSQDSGNEESKAVQDPSQVPGTPRHATTQQIPRTIVPALMPMIPETETATVGGPGRRPGLGISER